MIDLILHTIGLCPDAHSHLDLIDLVCGGVLSWGAISCYLRTRIGRKGDRP